MKKLVAVTAAALAVAVPVRAALAAQGATQSEPAALLDHPEQLKPGEWAWSAEDAPAGPVLVYVDLNRQLATVYRNGVRIAVTTVSTGRPGFATPTGVFTILQRDIDHHSSTYNDAPMPYTERLTWQGVALHAGGLPGYPSSHGCVHLPLQFARQLYGIESLGGTVIITGGYDTPNERPAAGILEPAVAGAAPPPALPSDEQYDWNPSAATAGPVSIIVSSGDQQVVVLRNGVEIGRSKAEIPAVVGTNVMTYAGGQSAHWIEVGASAPGADPTRASSIGVEQLKLPPAFASAIRSVIVPGTTLITTQDSLSQQSTGPRATVLDADDAKS